MNQVQEDAVFEELAKLPPHVQLQRLNEGDEMRRLAGGPPPDSYFRQRAMALRMEAREAIAKEAADADLRSAREMTAFVDLTNENGRLPTEDEVDYRAETDPDLDAIAERFNDGARLPWDEHQRVKQAIEAGYFERYSE